MSQDNLQSVLKDVFGYDSFRGEQETIIKETLSGKNTLVLMPTGMGKSLCYQLPAKILSGLTLVISPLIALMKDQVDVAVQKGFKAAYINSSLNRKERENRYKKLAAGDYELLYVTPERFRKEEFLEAVSKNSISLLAIDEAHCISQWGHDFRPDYTRIQEFRSTLGEPVTMALTATATPTVQSDIIKQMGLTEEEIVTYQYGVERPNLQVRVQDVYGMDDKVRAFMAFSHSLSGAKIVYFSLVQTLKNFARELRKLGYDPLIYHGQLSDDLRKQMQEDFLRGQNDLILATPAFGLGIDKENVRMVFHAETPGSVEAYYQEIGRAGRDGNSSECYLLYDPDDISIQMDFIKWANPDPGFVSQVYHLVKDYPDRVAMEGADFLREKLNFYNRRDFRVETALNLLDRWDCLSGSVHHKTLKSTGELSGDFLDQELYKKRVKSQNHGLLAIVDYVKIKTCRMQYIYEYFGLKDTKPCGKCDNCASN